MRLKISMSLDGFVAGPDQSVADPLGIGGTRLHEWAFALAVARAQHGLEGGEVNESTPVVEESLANIGATVKAAQQYLAAGLVDEMEINLVPTLLGRGERLFDGAATDLRGLELVRTVATPKVVHLKFARR